MPPRRLPLVALGLGAGFLSAFLGIGGGLVVVPVLRGGLGFPLKRAVGTGLAMIVPVALVGVGSEWVVARPNLHLAMGGWLALSALGGSWLGGRALRRVDERPLELAYALFLAFAAWRMLAGAGAGRGDALTSLAAAPLAGLALTALVGLLAGLVAVLFGVGGGIVIVPALVLLLGEFPFHAARATSLVTIVPTAALSAWQHHRLGNIDRPTVRWLVGPGLGGAVLGVLAVNRLPARPCRIAFGLLLVAAALRIGWMVRRSFGPRSPRPA